jgi:hypothetical protein
MISLPIGNCRIQRNGNNWQISTIDSAELEMPKVGNDKPLAFPVAAA